MVLDPFSVLNGLQALVVDDQPDAQWLLTLMLEMYGVKVTAVASARAALEALKQVQPNFIVCDIAMPGEDGYSLIRKIRSLPSSEGGKVPAIALSALSPSEGLAPSLSAGFQAYLVKPCDPDELLTTIEHHLTSSSGGLFCSLQDALPTSTLPFASATHVA